MTGVQLTSMQLVPHTTVSPSSDVPHTTVSPVSDVPHTTVSPSVAAKRPTSQAPPQSAPPQSDPQTMLRDGPIAQAPLLASQDAVAQRTPQTIGWPSDVVVLPHKVSVRHAFAVD